MYDLAFTYCVDVSKCFGVFTGTPAMSAMAKVLVTVMDINDHSPVLTGSKYTPLEITTSDFVSGSAIYRAEATDNDIGDNGGIRYSLLSVSINNKAFTIDERTGDVFPHGSPESRFYYMMIIASDRGEPSKSTYMHLFVKVCQDPAGGWFCTF